MVATTDVVGVGLACVAIPALVLVTVAIRNREEPGARGFAVGTFAIACWSVTTGLRIFLETPPLVYRVVLVQPIFSNLTVLGWTLLVIEFRHRRRVRLWRPLTVAVLVVPVCTVLIALTNDWHHLMYTTETYVDQQGLIQLSFGPWYPVHLVYLLLLNVVPALVLLREFVGSSGIHRRQVTLLVTAWAVAFLGTFDFYLKTAGLWPLPPYADISPLGFLLASGVWGLALFRHGLFELVPIGRRTAVETMPDAVLTVDSKGTVVDANPAARSLFDGDLLRESVSAVFDDYPGLLDHYREGADGSTDVPVLRNGTVEHYAATTTPIVDQGTQTGTLVVLRDVTELKNREQELDLHGQVHSRIVRHNLRNELTVIRGNAEEIVRMGDGPAAEFAATILDRSDALVETSEKARRIMRIIEDDGDLTTVESCSLVERLVTEMHEQYPAARLETTHPDEAWVTVHEDLEVAVRNLVENAIVHSGERPRVEITIERTGETVEITVSDDGPGIPEQEVAVLDQLEETALEHGSGAGLWLVNWVATKSGGSLDFAVSERGTTATLRVQHATD